MKDCRNNALPDYSFIEPPYVDQEDGTLAADHHPDNFVPAGDLFIRNVYGAIRSSDEVWRSTLLLIVWDEHGGIFDHVSPPTLPYGDSFRSGLSGFNEGTQSYTTGKTNNAIGFGARAGGSVGLRGVF